jgi:hypothetical protein
LGAFLDIEGAFDKTSVNAITMAARQRGLEENCCRFKADSYTLPSLAAV